MKSYSKFRSKALKNIHVRQEYEKMAPEFKIAAVIIEKRLEKGISQAELAKKIGTKQSAISRLESGDYNPSISFLVKVAKALDVQLVVSLS